MAQEMDFYWAHQFGSDNNANQIKSVSTDHRDQIIAFTDFEGDFDVDGIVYQAEEGSDLLLFVLNEQGEHLWSIAGGGPGDQKAQEVHCDSDGNIYIMGLFESSISLGVFSFESNGSFDMFIAKYSNEGDLLWLNSYGGPNSESFETMKIKHKNLYLGGRFYNYTILENDTIFSTDGTDVFVAKINLNGELLDAISIGGESVDMISSIDVDLNGNVFIAGDFYQNIQFGDLSFDAGESLGLYLAKFDVNLDFVWAYQFEGDDLRPNLLLGLDSESNITVAGTFSSNLSFGNIQLNTADFDEDIFVAHFSEDGLVNWASRFYSNSMESVIGLQVDRLGNAYLAGHYLNHINFNDVILQYNLCCGDPEIFFVKLDNTGELLDANQLTGERSQVSAMTVPEVNQVVLAGQFSDELAIGDMTLHSLSSYNVFVTYYKDDTWLRMGKKSMANELSIYPSLFHSSFQINDLQDNSTLFIFNEKGQLMEEIHHHGDIIVLGYDWPVGLYLIKNVLENGDHSIQKVIKL